VRAFFIFIPYLVQINTKKIMGYVVKQRWLSGKGKKFFESGDVVTERDFPENFQELIREGRIELVEDGSESDDEKALKIQESLEQARLAKEDELQAESEAKKALELENESNADKKLTVVLTQEDFDQNPDLAEQDLKVGDTVELEIQEEKANEGENLDPKTPFFHFDPKGENRPIFSDEDLNKEELIRHLMNNGIAFKGNEGKAKLWEKAITPIAE